MQDKTSPPAPPVAAAPGQGSHDTDVPPALKEFLLSGWRPFSPDLPPPMPHADSFASRRQRLSAQFPGEVLVIPAGHEKLRANDTYFRFRPGSDFYYLTGSQEPDSVLVLEPLALGGHQAVLYAEPVTRDDISFFSDRNKGELWVGRRMGLDHSRAYIVVDEARSLKQFDLYLRGLVAGAPAGTGSGRPVRLLRGVSEKVDAARSPTKADTDFAALCAELRLEKDARELEEMQVVIDATARGFEDVIRGMRDRIRTEREVEVAFYARARTEGNDVGYGTIAAGGAHACVLHWTRNDAPLDPTALLLLDAGVEGKALYTADITRTLPVSGKFSKEQREIYDLVWEAQQAAIATIRPGVDFMEPNKVAMKVLAEGLERLGILPMPAAEALLQEKQLYRRYSLHNISHMLGIDVHDCAKARREVYKYGPLKVGMVLTVEPGLYFQLDDLTVPERYRGIGVRIEDDVVVTEAGCTNLSAGIPSQADAVEQWMARLWA